MLQWVSIVSWSIPILIPAATNIRCKRAVLINLKMNRLTALQIGMTCEAYIRKYFLLGKYRSILSFTPHLYLQLLFRTFVWLLQQLSIGITCNLTSIERKRYLQVIRFQAAYCVLSATLSKKASSNTKSPIDLFRISERIQRIDRQSGFHASQLQARHSERFMSLLIICHL